MLIRLAALLTLAVAPAFCQTGTPGKPTNTWIRARRNGSAGPWRMHSGVACVSCHTGLRTVSRPAFSQALNEKSGPTLYEGVLVASMRATVIRTDANDLFDGLKGAIVDQVYGAQVVLSSLVLAMDDVHRGRLSPEGEKAFERMWSIQVKDGADKGAWLWSDFDLDPWETRDSLSMARRWERWPPVWRRRITRRARRFKRTSWPSKPICATGQKTQSLHNRLFLLWASSKLHGLADRRGPAGHPGRAVAQTGSGRWLDHAIARPMEEARSRVPARLV